MFQAFSKAVHARFTELSKGELFVAKVPEIFDKYLSAFPAGTNPVFRQRTVHDCQCCKQFVRRLGNVVAIRDGKVLTVWDDLDIPEPFKTVADAMAQVVKEAKIQTVFRTKERK